MIRGDHQKILAADMKEETRKDYKTGGMWADPWHGDSSEAEWDRTNLNYRVLMIYYVPSFHTHGCKVILQSAYSVQTDLQSWQMPLTWSNTEQKLIFSWFVYTAHSISVLVQTCMLPLEACMFSETKPRHQRRQVALSCYHFDIEVRWSFTAICIKLFCYNSIIVLPVLDRQQSIYWAQN